MRIQVQMLGRFDIIADGDSVLYYLGNSAKSIQLIKFLILKKGAPILSSDLIDIFWSEVEKCSNPENALKTMVSRIRSNLCRADPSFKNCIVSDNKAYFWNPEIICEVDVFAFEALYEELREVKILDADTRSKFVQALSMYTGDLAYTSSGADWIVSHSLYLRQLYFKTVYHFIDLLKDLNDLEMIVHTCRAALDIDTFDEQLNLEMMTALKNGGQNHAALLQYRHITSVYYKYLGVEPSEKLLGFYKNLIKSELAEITDINIIQSDLKNINSGDGAYVCDYSIFKDIYLLQLRNIERQENKMFLALITISRSVEDPLHPIQLDVVMRDLMEILQKCLRKGDMLSRYSPSQFAILLPAVNYQNGNKVTNRIKSMFYKQYTDNSVRIAIQYGTNEASPRQRPRGITHSALHTHKPVTPQGAGC